MIEPNIITRRQLVFFLGGLISSLSSCQAKTNIDQLDEITRTATHSLGSIQVPRDPQRIIALTGTIELDCLLALGIQPIAAAAQENSGTLYFHPHYADLLPEAIMLPSRGQVSVEAILELRPDFLIGTEGWLREIYSQLSQIAPTYIVSNQSDRSWQEYLHEIASLFDDLPHVRIAPLIETYQNRIDNLRSLYNSRIQNLTYSLVHLESLLSEKQIYIYNHDDATSIIESIGLKPLPDRGRSDYFFRYSLESLDLIDSDIIFMFSYDVNEVQKTQALQGDPLLRRLKAVEADQVYVVPSPYWYLTGPLAVQWILDDLENVILPVLTPS